MGDRDRSEAIPVARLRTAQADAKDLVKALVPETLEKCHVAQLAPNEGLTNDEKFLAITRLEVNGRTRSSVEERTHDIRLPNEEAPILKLRYGWVCQTGFYPDDLMKENQDNLLVAPDLGPSFPHMSIFGVFDGHGKFGTECSTFAVDRFGKNLLANKSLSEKPELALEEAVVKSNAEMHKQKKKRKGAIGYFDDTMSGTTSISILFIGDEILVSNVGDSRAIIATKNEKGVFEAQPLSADQTPYRADERKRCQDAGAVVMSMDQLEGYRPYNPDEDWGCEEEDGGDPPRLWLPQKGCPGVAFTRSIGDDMAESIGCIPNPEIMRRQLVSDDKFIVIASDGVFEFMSSETVVEIVAKCNDPYEAARAVVTEAYKLWLHYEVRTDDITAIVIFTEHRDKIQLRRGSSCAKFRDAEIGDMNEIRRLNKPVRREMSRRKRAMIEASSVVFEEEENSEDDEIVDGFQEKSADEIERISRAISTNFLFQNLSKQQLSDVLRAFERIEVEAGQAIIQQGQLGDKFYVVDVGEFDCFLERDGKLHKVHTYVGNRSRLGSPSFGELALMYSKPRAATIKAKTDGVLYALGRRTFRRLFIKSPNREKMEFLRKVQIFESLSRDQLKRLAAIIKEVKFPENHVIIHQGTIGDSMYIIKRGAARCLIKQGDSNPREVMEIKEGGYFGERAILNDEPRAASVIAKGDMCCLYISRSSFEEVLGRLSDIIARDGRQREMEAAAEAEMAENSERASIPIRVALSDLKSKLIVSTAETTTYRVVSLRDAPKRLFTLKSYRRKAIEMLKAETMVLKDRKLLPLAALSLSRSSKSSFDPVFPLLKTFVGKDNLHIALAGVSCGPLNDFMAEPLHEDIVRFVVANVALIIERLHSRGILCRAINPEALMLNNHGIVQISDLGSGKYLEDEVTRAFTMCGLEVYLAPEQVLNAGHSFQVDFWALGVLTYELLCGHLPFKDEKAVLSEITCFEVEQLSFPPHVSKSSQDLITHLLQPNPERRLASIEDLQNAEFFASFGWNKFRAGEMPSPLKTAAEAALEEIITNPTPRDDERIDSGAFQGTSSPVWFAGF